MKIRQRLRQYHIWIGWIIGLPLLAWTVSGLIMVSRPIETVRGEDLLRAPAPLAFAAPPVPPPIGPRPISSLSLAQGSGGPQWVIHYADGGARRASPADGRLLPALTAADAAEIVRARYVGKSRIARIERIDAANPPLDLRRKIDSWRVAMADGTHFYVAAATGEILARRTRFWRFYDFMWGLHIMDLRTREDSSNPIVIGLAVMTLAAILLALVLLPMTLRRRN